MKFLKVNDSDGYIPMLSTISYNNLTKENCKLVMYGGGESSAKYVSLGKLRNVETADNLNKAFVDKDTTIFNNLHWYHFGVSTLAPNGGAQLGYDFQPDKYICYLYVKYMNSCDLSFAVVYDTYNIDMPPLVSNIVNRKAHYSDIMVTDIVPLDYSLMETRSTTYWYNYNGNRHSGSVNLKSISVVSTGSLLDSSEIGIIQTNLRLLD